MCGIAGVSRNTTTSIPNGRKFAIALTHAIEDRGKDSTGFGWGEKDDPNHVYYSKLAGRATKVADLQPLPGTGIHSLIAHTRHGTKGSPLNNDNNHPVVAEHIVLVHNGRVDNDDELIELAGMKSERVGIVDSWAIPALLSKQKELGASTTDLLELVEGVAAVAWLSSWEPGVLHLARLSTRPLTIGFTRRGDLVFASTTSNMRKAAALGKVHIDDICTLKEGTHLKIVEGAIEEWSEFKPRHPKIEYAVDLPGVSAPKQINLFPAAKAPAPKPKGKGKRKGKHTTTTMSHAEYLAYLDRQQRDADDKFFDNLPDNAWERDVDWENLAPRRGWK